MGYVNSINVTVLGLVPGQTATLQLRVFDGGDWESSLMRAYSNTVDVELGGGPLPPAALEGLNGFVLPVPELSTIALGSHGLAALVVRRRTKSNEL